jgi:hypothetical protein
MAYVPTTYMTIQIQTDSFNIGDFNSALSGGATKPEETLANINNIISAIQGGLHNAQITVNCSTNAGTVSGQTGGTATFTLNLT